MKPPFDIAGDLDTPVSAFMKLKVEADDLKLQEQLQEARWMFI